MAKKRKGGSRGAQPSGPKDMDPKDARLTINSYEDVADSEDEYFLNKDRIMFDEDPRDKKKREEDEAFDFSDEEVLGLDGDASDSGPRASKSKVKGRKAAAADDDDEEAEQGEEDGDEDGWWGASKGDYYNADNIETEADALEEEAEAKRLQQKKLAKMNEADFLFDEDEWKQAGAAAEDDQEDVVTEVLKDVQVTDDMGPEERMRLLRARYPELEPLAKEFDQLQPKLVITKAAAAGQPKASLSSVKYWVLGCYVAALASYFAILTSPARDSGWKVHKPLDPAELRDHDVMATLIRCRDAWRRIEPLQPKAAAEEAASTAELDAASEGEKPEAAKKKTSKKAKAIEDEAEARRAQRRQRKLEKARAAEASVADLYDLPLGRSSGRKRRREEVDGEAADGDGDGASDFGEETTLDARTAADKAARKKSLKFYTSQIAQKSNKRARAGVAEGGDQDLPYRERFRDRQARLMAEAEKRGRRDHAQGAALGEASDEEDAQAADGLRGDEDDYYDMVASASRRRREDKADRFAAIAAAGRADRVVEQEEVGEDGKRRITYAIEKNKGLAPRRNKDNRNPRVKKRKQYEAKQKKLRSMKPMFKGGEPTGGYSGEKTGINMNVIKSTRL